MKIAYDPEKFGELKPGDDVQLMATGVVSDDGTTIEVVSIEDEEISEEEDEEKDSKKNSKKDSKKNPKEETEAEADEELTEGADLASIIASGVGL